MEGWWFGLVCSCRSWITCSHWVNHKIVCVLKFSKVKWEVISQSYYLKRLTLGHGTGQWSQTAVANPQQTVAESVWLVHTSTWLKLCNGTISITECQQSVNQLKQFWSQLLGSSSKCETDIIQTTTEYFYFFAAEEGCTSVESWDIFFLSLLLHFYFCQMNNSTSLVYLILCYLVNTKWYFN